MPKKLMTRTNSLASITVVFALNSFFFGGSLLKPSSVQAGSNGCGSGWASKAASNLSGFGGRFRGACNTHDICYETKGRSKPSCDDQFHRDLKRACNGLWIKGPCLGAAYTFWRAVAIGGHDAYRASQRR